MPLKDNTKWDESKPDGPEDSTSPALDKDAPALDEKPYVHEPGTVHLNAFLGAVNEAEQKVSVAQVELTTAKDRLHQKKVESGMI